jgi:hypothetical protein
MVLRCNACAVRGERKKRRRFCFYLVRGKEWMTVTTEIAGPESSFSKRGSCAHRQVFLQKEAKKFKTSQTAQELEEGAKNREGVAITGN